MTELATFAAGCFWGVEADFRSLPGVVNATVGYTGGSTENPTYKQVCSGRTDHAEAVLVEFDPAVITYEQLLGAFWKLHDPTQVNRQGPDHGSQYRTAIFFHSPEQKAAAQATKTQVQPQFKRPIATEITPAPEFYPAEEYHQQYLAKNGIAHCRIN